MRCSDAARRIHDYVSGELEGDDRERLEKHLETCEDCRSCVDENMALRSRVRDLMRVSAPASLRAEVVRLSQAQV